MIDNALLEALGKTLVDSIGQGLAVLLITIFALWLKQKKSARVRHNILLVSILVLPILSVNSFVNSYEPRSEVMHNASSSSDHLDFATLGIGSGSEFDVSTNELEQENAFVSPTALIWLSYAWIVGFSFYLIRIFGSFFYLNRLNRKARRIEFTYLNDLLNRIKVDLGLKRQVILKTSERVTSPLIYGVFRPIIIFPLGLIQGLTTEEVEGILLHELSHLKRNDFIINIVINVLKTIYFYHPAFWWMSVQLDNEREFASDEMVLHHKVNALDLIKALSKTQEYQMSVPAVAFAGSSKNQLLKRVNRIMKKQQKPNWLGGLLAIVLLASTLVLTSQQAKEKVEEDQKQIQEELKVDSVYIQIPLFTSEKDSISYKRRNFSFHLDSLSLEKALAEIVQKKQKFMLEKLENGKITNVTRGRSELKGDSLKVYKQAFEMLEGYAETYKNSETQRKRLLYEKEYQQQVRALAGRYNDIMKDEEISQSEYRKRIKQIKKEMMEVTAFEKSSIEQKAEMIEYLIQLEGGRALAFEDFSEMNTKENLKRLEERLLLMQKFVEQKDNKEELNSQMKLYNEELKELQEVLREKREDQSVESKRLKELLEIEYEQQEQLQKVEDDVLRVLDDKQRLKPTIWVHTKSAKDTLVVESLETLNPDLIEELKVYKGDAARKLLPNGKAKNGLILIEVDKPTYQKIKKTSKKLKRK